MYNKNERKMSMKLTFVSACEEALARLGLDDVPIIEAGVCYYDCTEDYIGMNIEDANSLELEWYDNVSQYLSNGREFSLVLWSLLHEYGHYQDTMETWADAEDTFFRELMYMMPEGSYERRMAYFNLPSEKVATQWAADFIRENEELCREVDKVLSQFAS